MAKIKVVTERDIGKGLEIADQKIKRCSRDDATKIVDTNWLHKTRKSDLRVI